MVGRFVYFDLETSGSKVQEIIQIGAVGSRNDEPEFSNYLLPFGSIAPYCTDNVHGIYKVGNLLIIV
jgi:DNA polymerase III epsilon subunit-like protein